MLENKGTTPVFSLKRDESWRHRSDEDKKGRQIYDPPKIALMSPCGVWKSSIYILMPENKAAIKLKLLAKAHCGCAVHRGKNSTRTIIRSEFHRRQLGEGVEDFVLNCFHCIIARSWERIPCPLARALHGQLLNEVIHMYFLYIGPVRDSVWKYVLILEDYLTSYSWLPPHSSLDSEAAVESPAKWIAAFGSMI